MSTPQNPDPLANLAESLTREHSQAQEASRQQVIDELKAVIAQVPEQSEFTNTRRFKVWGPILLVGALVLLGMAIHAGNTKSMIFTLVMVALFAVLTWQHRNAGNAVFMRLNRRQLTVDTLSAPVELTDIADIHVKDEGLITQQTLTLRPGAPLPKHRATFKLFGNQALALAKPAPNIRIQSAGVMRNGQRLHIEEIAAVLDAYRMAAHAQQQLDALQRR
ncbi:hypothetical protein SJI00_18455 [Pseudomonas sp. RP23018S]|uniref:hypothetical protein n=1 Tax=Pseudomonas sp. RP23018S TaxID=3096037 RepID=UPI002ACA32AC|nr:hypothetical protein [Pseudomonas sp. RP23018S]MDZ5604754.1 hypothetical protein [Pseudomonas sp. RP23018S]